MTTKRPVKQKPVEYKTRLDVLSKWFTPDDDMYWGYGYGDDQNPGGNTRYVYYLKRSPDVVTDPTWFDKKSKSKRWVEFQIVPYAADFTGRAIMNTPHIGRLVYAPWGEFLKIRKKLKDLGGDKNALMNHIKINWFKQPQNEQVMYVENAKVTE